MLGEPLRALRLDTDPGVDAKTVVLIGNPTNNCAPVIAGIPRMGTMDKAQAYL